MQHKASAALCEADSRGKPSEASADDVYRSCHQMKA
jgi:hypothetical protein